MFKLIARLLALVGLLVVLLIVGLVAFFIYLDSIVETAIEKGSTRALGVNTSLDGTDVGVFSGELTLEGLNVANPDGFEEASFLTLEDGYVQVGLESLREEVVHVPSLKLTGIDVSLERKGDKSNYQTILDNLDKLRGTPAEEPAPAEEAPGKRYMFDEIVISDVTVHIALLPIGGDLSKTSVNLNEIRLTDIGTESGRGVQLAQVTRVVVQAILEATVEAAGSKLPFNMRTELESGLQSLGDLTEIGVGAIEGYSERLEELREQSGAAIEGIKTTTDDLGQKAGETVKDIGKVFEGFGNKKEEQAPEE